MFFFYFQVSVVAEEGQGAAEEAEEEAVLVVDEGDGEAAEVEVDRGGENPIDLTRSWLLSMTAICGNGCCRFLFLLFDGPYAHWRQSLIIESNRWWSVNFDHWSVNSIIDQQKRSLFSFKFW